MRAFLLKTPNFFCWECGNSKCTRDSTFFMFLCKKKVEKTILMKEFIKKITEWVKPVSPHLGVNGNLNISNRYMSVKGCFGVGAAGFLGVSGYCFCTKKPWIRPLVASAVFGCAYLYLDDREQTKAAKKQSPTKEVHSHNVSSETPTTDNPRSFELKSYSQLNDVAANNPGMWFVQGFVAVGLINYLLAGAGIGKSIFMVQIAVVVATGTKIAFLPCDSIVPRKTDVVFYRIEVFASEYRGKYGVGEVLDQSGIKWRDRKDLPTPDFNGLIADLKQLVETLNDDTLICIDPISKFDDFNAGRFAEEVENLQNRARKKGINLTFLCSAHLDEIAPWQPLTTSDIRGGDRLIQTAGSVFSIRKERTDDNHRFLQSLKEPKGSPNSLNGQVLVCKAVEEVIDDNNKFLHYEFIGIKPETEARPLKPKAESEESRRKSGVEPKRRPNINWTEEMETKLTELHNDGINDCQIAEKMSDQFELKLTGTQIDRRLKKMRLRPQKPGGTKK